MDFWSRYAPSALAGKEGRSTDATLVASIRQVSFSSDTRRWDQPDRPCRSIRLALLPTHEHPRQTSPLPPPEATLKLPPASTPAPPAACCPASSPSGSETPDAPLPWPARPCTANSSGAVACPRARRCPPRTSPGTVTTCGGGCPPRPCERDRKRNR